MCVVLGATEVGIFNDPDLESLRFVGDLGGGVRSIFSDLGEDGNHIRGKLDLILAT